MEKKKHIQNNYEQLKKISDKTEDFMRIVNDLKEDNKTPKTEKGLNKKAKTILDRVNKKIVKENKKKK